MKDFNFFDELVVSRKKKTSSSTYILLSAILLFAVLGLISFYYIQQFSALKDENAMLQGQLNDPSHKKAYEEANVIKLIKPNIRPDSGFHVNQSPVLYFY